MTYPLRNPVTVRTFFYELVSYKYISFEKEITIPGVNFKGMIRNLGKNERKKVTFA